MYKQKILKDRTDSVRSSTFISDLLLQFCCHLLSPSACHQDAQVFCIQRSPNWTRALPPGTCQRPLCYIHHPQSQHPHTQWAKYSGVFPQVRLGLVLISHSSPYICKDPMTMWNPSWWISKCLPWQVTGSWKNLHASLNICWYKYLCSPESLLTCSMIYDLRHLWAYIWLTCVK